MPEQIATGGCFCGAIRYEISGTPEQVVVCHCPDCRRAAGAQSVAWLIVAMEQFRISKGSLTSYNSSRGVTRTFCSTCGTTLTWVGDKHPARIDITVGSLDDPERFAPTKAVYRKHKLSWVSLI